MDMKILKLPNFCLIALMLLTNGCKSDDSPDPITYADVEQAFQNIAFTPGIQDLSLNVSETQTYEFRVIIPDVDLTQKLPLIFALHGASNGEPTAHMNTDCYVEPGLDALDAVIISPNSGVTIWGTVENQDKMRILVDLSTRFWPVDLNRVAVMGYSSGGNGTWFYTESQPQIFSAGIAIASGYNVLRPDNTARTMPRPLYVIHGENDDFFPVDTVSFWVDQTIQAGSSIEFVIAPGLGHYTPCDYVPYIETAALWLRDEIWR
jgi:predicted peptidase